MLRETLYKALTEATKMRDARRTATLRLINAAVKDRDIANRGNGKDPVSDDDILQILSKMIKQREESVEMYEGAGRIDLADQERAEIVVISEFLPRQLDEESVRKVCAKVVEDTGASGLRDMGRCINALKEQYPGQIDFSKASGIVRGLLR